MSKSVETPWKPATSTILSWSSASWMRRARTSTIFAWPCTVSVTIPACEPVSEIASAPRSWIAIAASAHEIRSPTEISMSSSRGFGRGGDLVGEADEVVGRVAHRREHGDDAVAGRLRAATSRCATSLIRSGSATDVPPNFITSVPARGSAAATVGKRLELGGGHGRKSRFTSRGGPTAPGRA